MPIVRIDIHAGKSPEHKRGLLLGVRGAITSVVGVPDDRVIQRIVETPAENVDTTDTRSDRLTIVEISMLAGRGAQVKERLYREIADRLLADPGISENDLVVLVNDPPGECFFVHGAMLCTPPIAEESSDG